MGKFADIALPLIAKGVPCVPVLPGTKKAFLPDFPALATTDLAQILSWDSQFPGYNGACVARHNLNEVWFFEVDSPDVVNRIEADTGRRPPMTLMVRSRPGRGHFYFRQSPASIAMGNLKQDQVKHGDFSVRVNNQYVVAPGSIHPDSGLPYEALTPDADIVEAPEWLISWLLHQRIERKGIDAPRNEKQLVPHGSIHGYMLSVAGKLRETGLEQEEIEPILLKRVHDNCEPPIDDDKVKEMARSVCALYPAGIPAIKLQMSSEKQQPIQNVAHPEVTPFAFKLDEHPVFPDWVMEGTSIYENFVKPVISESSRVGYFMWLPAMVIMMNYLSGKIRIQLHPLPSLSIYMLIIGEKGKAHKSSSCKSAMTYMERAGILRQASLHTKNAEGGTLVWTPGSAEGLGLEMNRTNCKNAIIWYDELSTLVSKAGIDASSLRSGLLTMYEADKFANAIKSRKEQYSLEPNDYCTSVIACTTDRKFQDLWATMAGADTGLNDRFFFVYQPEKLPERKLFKVAERPDPGIETRKLIDKAVQKQLYHYIDTSMIDMIEMKYGPRESARAQKFALALAVDLGRDVIDEDCTERAAAIIEYEHAVKQYVRTFDARNDEALFQRKVVNLLKRNGGRMLRREVEKQLRVSELGTSLWEKVYKGLERHEYMIEEGTGRQGDPIYIQLLKDMDEED